jgi:hypothetical protein
MEVALMPTGSSASPNGTAITITLGNQDFTMRREVWPIDQLKLDPTNPRLQFTLRKTGMAASDKDLHRLIWDLDPVKALYQSVYQNGGLLEDPVVKRDGRVVEGNCRTVVLRELRKKYAQDTRWQQVFVRVLPDAVTDEQTMLLLGELHIAGKIEWRAIDQAEYAWKMNKVFGRTYDFLTNHLRWSRSRLSQKIAAYEETKAYAARTNDPQAINRFSHFEEFMGERPLRERRDADPTFMATFGDWVAAGKFPDAKDVRVLSKIIDHPDAMATLEKANVQKAQAVLFAENPALQSNLYSIVDRASEQLETIALSELTALKAGDGPRVAKLRRLQLALRSIEPYIGPLPP